MKNLKQFECEVLTDLACLKIEGGSVKPKGSFWQELAYFGELAFLGMIAFSSQGGRNAGLTVK